MHHAFPLPDDTGRPVARPVDGIVADRQADAPEPKAADPPALAGAMSQEYSMLRSASGARMAELTDVTRPRLARRAPEAAVCQAATSAWSDGAVWRDRGGRRRSSISARSMRCPAARGNAEWQCFAQAIYFESRGEPLDGRIAVAEVVLNRRDEPQLPGHASAA